MPLNLPSSPKESVNRSKTDVQRELQASNPFLRNSFLSAIVTSCALRVYDFYEQLRLAIKELFIQTASIDFLKMFGEWFGISQNPAVKANGNVVFTGTASSTILAGTSIQSSDGLIYTTDNSGTVTATVLSVTSLTRSGSTVTATTAIDHNLANNVEVTVAGAVETEYNGPQEITVTGSNTFTYQITTTPSTPATGTITASHTSVNVPVTPELEGSDYNQVSGVDLSLSSPISGVDNTVTVDFAEISGGTDAESEDDYRSRLLDRTQNPVSLFNVAAITVEAKKVPGVTRVFVQEITPAEGQVTIYFVRDNDSGTIIPSAGEVSAVKSQVLTIKPAQTSDADVIVSAPTAVPVNFTFTTMSPNTTSMQEAVQSNLEALFRSKPVAEDVTEDDYRATIKNTVDLETGDSISTFTLSTPSGDVAIASDEIPTLGTVTFA